MNEQPVEEVVRDKKRESRIQKRRAVLQRFAHPEIAGMLSLLSLPRCRAKLPFYLEFTTWPSRKYSLPAWRIRQQNFRRPTNPEHEFGWTFNHKNRIGYHKVPWRALQKTRDVHHIQNDEMRVFIHKLLWILRHHGLAEGLNVRLDGFIRIDELLRHPRFHGSIDMDTLLHYASHDPKHRFKCISEPDISEYGLENGVLWIRAKTGHTAPSIDTTLRRLLPSPNTPSAIYFTSSLSWERLSQEGISVGKGDLIRLFKDNAENNFVSKTPHEKSTIIHIDMLQALQDGIKIYLTRQGEFVTSGDSEGKLEPRYFFRVHQVKIQNTAVADWEEDHQLYAEDIPLQLA